MTVGCPRSSRRFGLSMSSEKRFKYFTRFRPERPLKGIFIPLVSVNQTLQCVKNHSLTRFAHLVEYDCISHLCLNA